MLPSIQHFIRNHQTVTSSLRLRVLIALVFVIYLTTFVIPAASEDNLSQVRLLTFTAGASLLLGLFTLISFFGPQSRFRKFLFSISGIFLISFGLPVLLLLLPDFFLRFNTGRSWHPDGVGNWLWLFQSVYLGITLLFRQQQPLQPTGRLYALLGWVALGLFTGLGLWLTVYFLLSFQGFMGQAALESLDAFPLHATGLVLLTAGIISPWSAELFFRRDIIAQATQRFGYLRACLLAAALYALIQVRPILWIPAFVFAILMTYLVHHSKNLLPAVVAHALFNILVLLIQQSWFL